MMIAEWRVEARFGHKEEVIKLMKVWAEEFGAKVGWTPDKIRMKTGSLAAAESVVVSEVEIEDLTVLGESFEKLRTIEGHAKWGKKMEPHVVSGSNSWSVYRVV